jgi:prepilin-type N-terminal cleavage/methylation domain-containing protein
MKKNNYKLTTAFTLIELMITIAIIAIIILSLNNIDFNKMSSNQRLDMFTNSIITNIENIRNNALL